MKEEKRNSSDIMFVAEFAKRDGNPQPIRYQSNTLSAADKTQIENYTVSLLQSSTSN